MSEIKCNSCYKYNPSDSKYCLYCGKPLRYADVFQDQRTLDQTNCHKKKRLPMWMYLFVAILFIIGSAAIYNYMIHPKDLPPQEWVKTHESKIYEVQKNDAYISSVFVFHEYYLGSIEGIKLCEKASKNANELLTYFNKEKSSNPETEKIRQLIVAWLNEQILKANRAKENIIKKDENMSAGLPANSGSNIIELYNRLAPYGISQANWLSRSYKEIGTIR